MEPVGSEVRAGFDVFERLPCRGRRFGPEAHLHEELLDLGLAKLGPGSVSVVELGQRIPRILALHLGFFWLLLLKVETIKGQSEVNQAIS